MEQLTKKKINKDGSGTKIKVILKELKEQMD